MAIAQLVVAAFAFALGIVVAKPAMTRLGLRFFLVIRVATCLTGALVLWLVADCPLTIEWGQAPLVVMSLLVCPVLLNLLFFAGLARGAVGPVNALRFTAPLWAVLLALICWGAMPSLAGLLSLALIVGGVAVLAGKGVTGGRSRLALGLALASGASQGGSVLLQQAVLDILPREELLLYQNAGFALVLMIWTGFAPRREAELPNSPGHRLGGIVLAILSGLMVYVIGEYLKFHSLPHSPGPAAVAILQLSLPFSAVQAAFILGERPGRRELLGIVLITLGSLLAPFLLGW
jgi:drug/metabolite transporter (DMT)-like permease